MKTPIRNNEGVIDYLIEASKLKLVPNFFVSLPYLRFFGAKLVKDRGWMWLEVPECPETALFPPIKIKDELGTHTVHPPIAKIWSDFSNYTMSEKHWVKATLDWEYIYDPFNFSDLSGGRWATFRKNIRKWPGHQIQVSYTPNLDDPKKLEWLLIDWLEKHPYTHDPELIAHMVLEAPDGVTRMFLYHEDRLAGVNVWDINWFHVNYRFCICWDEPFLDEYLRYRFYTSPEIRDYQKPVCDGGVLDSKGLEKFKDKLQPIRKREVFSWRIKQ
jgi:hypothetical protein